jgi:hypothetical protein
MKHLSRLGEIEIVLPRRHHDGRNAIADQVAHGVRDKPWSIREFVILDPSGVAWRVSQTLGKADGQIT